MGLGRGPRLFFAALAVAAILGGPAPAGARRDTSHDTGLRTVFYAKPPPDFSFDIGAGNERLRSLQGKPAVINFWASWCEPCTAELAAFAKLQPTFGDAITLVTLSAEPAGVARHYLDAHQLGLPLVEDPTRKVFDAYSVQAIPVTVVVGRDGSVTRVVIGELNWDELRTAVEAQLAAPSPAPTAIETKP
jgi:peroxiredoxin